MACSSFIAKGTPLIRFSFACPLLLCVPFATPAQTQTDAEPDRLTAAIEAAGCIGTEANGDAILAAAGPTEDVAGAIAMQFIADGISEADALRLTINSCAGAPTAPTETGLAAGITWMNAVSGVQTGNLLEEILTARGCMVRDDEVDVFTEDVARAGGTAA